MFKHRFIEFGRTALLAVCLFLVGGLQQSCKDWLDDYKYDDSEPDWLGASVYAFLEEGTPGHSYRNYVELIDSLGEKETLAKTGSKTLFVADDAAFDRFYANNKWGVKSIADMTDAQRKYLFYNTMLNNAILLDMMPNTSETSQGDCISRETGFGTIDSIPAVHSNYYPLHETWPTYNKYWDVFADREDTLLLAMTSNSMIHFFDDFLRKNAISVSDINFIFSKSGNMVKPYNQGDVFLYGNKLVNSGVDDGNFSEDSLTIVCKNGYVYRMDEVLLPPADMAGELRNREDTRIFSHLLDRFCIPVYNSELSGRYNNKKEQEGVVIDKANQDSIYSLRYFTGSYSGGSLFNGTGVASPSSSEVLSYDPGVAKGKNDIYAMLVPKDEHLYEYFADPVDGAGNFLIQRYAPDAELDVNYSPEEVGKLLEALDSIPQVSIATFLNNLMQESFTATVPSKFDRITDDANDDMKIQPADVDECLVANNGVLYLLNKVFSPAKFSSVAGPVDINDNMRIIKRFIDDNKYDYYLLAMDADYSLIVPDDKHFVYYDPLTANGRYEKEDSMKMYVLHYDINPKIDKNNPKLWYESFDVSSKTYEVGDTVDKDRSGYPNNIALELLEYLIIVHDKVEPRVHKDRLYYSTKGYGTVKIDARNPDEIKFYGGEQLEKGTEIVAVEVNGQTNGDTYRTVPAETSTENIHYSAIPTPPTKSIYLNMVEHANQETNDGLYEEFFSLCYPTGEKYNNLRSAMTAIYSGIDASLPEDSLKLYSIFYTDGKTNNGVPFLNTYHYTVYIPSNESIAELYQLGLPKWETIEREIADNPQRAMSMIRLVNSFIRYHFQDQSVYCDISPFFVPNVDGGKDFQTSLSTALIDNLTNRFYALKVKTADGKAGKPTIVVEDEWAKLGKAELAEVVNTVAEEENKTWNVMCRDIVGTDAIETSSFSVLQPIDRALLNTSLFGYDGLFARFAVTGERVDTMYVSGGIGGDAGFGGNCYLVANAGRLPEKVDGEDLPAYLQKVEVAYLMNRIDSDDENWINNVAHEALVYDKNGSPILITRDGYRVTVDAKGLVIGYDYYTETGTDGKKYKIKVSNAGVEIKRELLETETPDNENGSAGETSDEE